MLHLNLNLFDLDSLTKMIDILSKHIVLSDADRISIDAMQSLKSSVDDLKPMHDVVQELLVTMQSNLERSFGLSSASPLILQPVFTSSKRMQDMRTFFMEVLDEIEKTKVAFSAKFPNKKDLIAKILDRKAMLGVILAMLIDDRLVALDIRSFTPGAEVLADLD